MNQTDQPIPAQCRDCQKRKICEELGCCKSKPCREKTTGEPASLFAPYDFPDLRY